LDKEEPFGEGGEGLVPASTPVTPSISQKERERLTHMSFSDVLENFGGELVPATDVIDSDQYGRLLNREEKHLLVGVPFIMVRWTFNKGDFGKDFVSCWILTQQNDRYILNDGGVGVCDQLRRLTEDSGRNGMLACPKGLRVSEYDKTLDNGQVIPAKTYYIDLSL